jgi:Rps23 Pro-64 3,4-dihydroxylase Tpa1-like proline 4-hydroxylase
MTSGAYGLIRPLDRERLREQFRNAQPFPHIVIENFLVPGAAEEVAAAYPSFEKAEEHGFKFNFINEQRKIQVTDRSKFPDPVARLGDAILSPEFLLDLEFITGIPRLLADQQFAGGGMHLTGPGGRLDVHVDFNQLEERKLFRRLNILLYLNRDWREEWGGHIELWDKAVKTCHLRSAPVLNRCLIFETSDISFHGVAPVDASSPHVRQSFAAYYYTREAPEGPTVSHSTIFKARPNEKLRGLVYMPMEKLWRRTMEKVSQVRAMIRPPR